MTDIRAEIEAAILRISELINSKDDTLIDQFDRADDLLFVGSELYEIHRGVPDIAAFFTLLRSSELSVSWHWDRIDCGGEGDIVWFIAQGEVRLSVAGAPDHRPYRLSGVLIRRDGVLRWRQFHGSEPRL